MKRHVIPGDFVPKLFSATVLVLALSAAAWAQWACGTPGTFITATTARLGGTATVTWGSPTDAFAFTALALSDSPFATVVNGVGTVCLDTTSPAFQIVAFGALDANGRTSVSFTLPSTPALGISPPVFVLAGIYGSAGFEITQTIRVELENPDSYKHTSNPLNVPRVLHTATALNATPEAPDRRVFIAGGANDTFAVWTQYCIFDPTAGATTEFFDPLTRSFTMGPTLLVPRAYHEAVLLQDGRVLITGGVDSTQAATTSCEVFDPATNTMSLVAPMLVPRAVHRATVMNDGRVLVTGGLPTLVGTLPGVLGSGHDTGEVYDPATDTWTMVANSMISRRSFHAQYSSPDGRVLVISGANGGEGLAGSSYAFQYAYCSPHCSFYEPSTNAFTWGGVFQGFLEVPPGIGFGSAMDSNGNVVVTGGGTASPWVWTKYVGSTGDFYPIASLEGSAQVPRMFHGQVALDNNVMMIIGGWQTAGLHQVRFHIGASQWTGANIGTNPAIPGQIPTYGDAGGLYFEMTKLYDGSFLITGGISPDQNSFWLANSAGGCWVYTP